MLHTHSPLVISASTETWYFVAVAVLNMYIVHDLNDLDTYTLCTVLLSVHEQVSVMARHERKNYTCGIAHVLTWYVRAYIACVLLTSISWNFSSDSHASVKFKLSCTVYIYIYIYIYICISYNAGKSALPDIYALALGHARRLRAQRVRIYQAKHECLCYN